MWSGLRSFESRGDIDRELDPAGCRLFESFRRRIGIPIELCEEPPLSFCFRLALLLSQLVEMRALHPLSVFDQNRTQVRAQPANVSFHLRRGTDHRRGIEHGVTLQQGRECLRRGFSYREPALNVRPVGEGWRGGGFPAARRAEAQADIAVAPARLAELRKAPMFGGHDKIRGCATH